MKFIFVFISFFILSCATSYDCDKAMSHKFGDKVEKITNNPVNGTVYYYVDNNLFKCDYTFGVSITKLF